MNGRGRRRYGETKLERFRHAGTLLPRITYMPVSAVSSRCWSSVSRVPRVFDTVRATPSVCCFHSGQVNHVLSPPTHSCSVRDRTSSLGLKPVPRWCTLEGSVTCGLVENWEGYLRLSSSVCSTFVSSYRSRQLSSNARCSLIREKQRWRFTGHLSDLKQELDLGKHWHRPSSSDTRRLTLRLCIF